MANADLAAASESSPLSDINAWTRPRREGRNVRASYNPEGWCVAKAKCDNGWAIFRPDGTHADNLMWPSMLAAQLRAGDYARRG